MKAKWISLMALCVALVMCAGMALAAAEEFAEWDYFQFEELTDEDWDAKTISYQFIGGNVEDPNADTGNARSLVLMNLYEDGTVAYWQAGIYTTDGLPEECFWYDQDRFIRWGYFGTWTAEEDALKLHITKYYGELDPQWFDIEAKADGTGAYGIENMIVTGMAQSGDGEVKALNYILTGTPEVTYPTLQSWVDAWIGWSDTFLEL